MNRTPTCWPLSGREYHQRVQRVPRAASSPRDEVVPRREHRVQLDRPARRSAPGTSKRGDKRVALSTGGPEIRARRESSRDTCEPAESKPRSRISRTNDAVPACAQSRSGGPIESRPRARRSAVEPALRHPAKLRASPSHPCPAASSPRVPRPRPASRRRDQLDPSRRACSCARGTFETSALPSTAR